MTELAKAISVGTARMLGEVVGEMVVVVLDALNTGHVKLLSVSVPEEEYCTNDTLVPLVLFVIQD